MRFKCTCRHDARPPTGFLASKVQVKTFAQPSRSVCAGKVLPASVSASSAAPFREHCATVLARFFFFSSWSVQAHALTHARTHMNASFLFSGKDSREKKWPSNLTSLSFPVGAGAGIHSASSCCSFSGCGRERRGPRWQQFSRHRQNDRVGSPTWQRSSSFPLAF